MIVVTVVVVDSMEVDVVVVSLLLVEGRVDGAAVDMSLLH